MRDALCDSRLVGDECRHGRYSLGDTLEVRESRIGDEFRMDEEGELCHTIGNARRRARVVGVRVDGDRAATELRQDRLTGSAHVIEAAGRDDDEFRPLFPHRLP